MKYTLALVLLAGLAVLWNVPAHARAASELQYGLTEVYSTALRFVRIDRGCKVVDKDADAAFVAFECSDDGKTKRGSMEIIKTPTGVRTQVTLGDDTHGMELRWLELFERKLRDELGAPIPPPAPKPAAPPKDAGA
jgi:hypothetical protein